MCWPFGFLLQMSVLRPFFYLFLVFYRFIRTAVSYWLIVSINPIVIYFGNVFYPSMTSLLPFFPGVLIYTDYTLHVVQFVVFSLLASEFYIWLRRDELFTVCKAFSFWCFHIGLGHRDSVGDIHSTSTVEIKTGKVREGHLSCVTQLLWGRPRSRSSGSHTKSALPAA